MNNRFKDIVSVLGIITKAHVATQVVIVSNLPSIVFVRYFDRRYSTRTMNVFFLITMSNVKEGDFDSVKSKGQPCRKMRCVQK